METGYKISNVHPISSWGKYRSCMEYSDKIILPYSFLLIIRRNHSPLPPLFRVSAIKSKDFLTLGVLNFSSEENHTFFPGWILKQLNIEKNTEVCLELSPVSKNNQYPLPAMRRIDVFVESFVDYELCKKALMAYSTLGKGDWVKIMIEEKVYRVYILAMQPKNKCLVKDLLFDLNLKTFMPKVINCRDASPKKRERRVLSLEKTKTKFIEMHKNKISDPGPPLDSLQPMPLIKRQDKQYSLRYSNYNWGHTTQMSVRRETRCRKSKQVDKDTETVELQPWDSEEPTGRVLTSHTPPMPLLTPLVFPKGRFKQYIRNNNIMEGSKIIARNAYFEEILERVLNKKKKTVSLYICGKPGTGKTFTVDRVLKEIRLRKAYKRKFLKIIEVNGMQIASPSDVWRILHKILDLETSRSHKSEVFEYFSVLKKPIILVIDEFENLITKFNKELITEIFELPFTHQMIYLIGISNLIDLPDIFLPQLEKRNCVPEIKIFPPYSKLEIFEIIQEIYGEQSEATALEVCAAQVEKIGDARRALGICKDSLSNGKISLSSAIKNSKNWHSPLKILTDLPHMNKGAVVICKKLLLQNKLNTTQLHSAYKAVCLKEGGEGLPLKEFAGMLENLSAAGIFRLDGNAKNTLKLHPRVLVGWEDLEKAFKDLPEVLELAHLSTMNSWKVGL